MWNGPASWSPTRLDRRSGRRSSDRREPWRGPRTWGATCVRPDRSGLEAGGGGLPRRRTSGPTQDPELRDPRTSPGMPGNSLAFDLGAGLVQGVRSGDVRRRGPTGARSGGYLAGGRTADTLASGGQTVAREDPSQRLPLRQRSAEDGSRRLESWRLDGAARSPRPPPSVTTSSRSITSGYGPGPAGDWIESDAHLVGCLPVRAGDPRCSGKRSRVRVDRVRAQEPGSSMVSRWRRRRGLRSPGPPHRAQRCL